MATTKKVAASAPEAAAPADPKADRAEAAGRAQDIADDIAGPKAKATPDKASKDLTSKTYTALHAIVRNDQPVAPGATVKFNADEGEHVQDLLDAGAIADAEHADDKLAEADAARAADAARR
jgi:hypothetical protein